MQLFLQFTADQRFQRRLDKRKSHVPISTFTSNEKLICVSAEIDKVHNKCHYININFCISHWLLHYIPWNLDLPCWNNRGISWNFWKKIFKWLQVFRCSRLIDRWKLLMWGLPNAQKLIKAILLFYFFFSISCDLKKVSIKIVNIC